MPGFLVTHGHLFSPAQIIIRTDELCFDTVGWLGSFDTNRDTHTITTVMRSTTSVDRIDFPLISWTRSIASIQALVGGSPLIYPSRPPAGHPAVLLGYWVCLSQCGESINMLHFWYNRSAHESGEISVSVAASEIVRNTL